jgi:hypothetical protein
MWFCTYPFGYNVLQFRRDANIEKRLLPTGEVTLFDLNRTRNARDQNGRASPAIKATWVRLAAASLR